MSSFDLLCAEWAAVATPVYGIRPDLDAEAALHENLTRDARLYVSGFMQRWEALERRAQDLWAIRQAVGQYLDVAGNAHLGDCTPRQDLHSAFLIIKGERRQGASLHAAICALDRVSYSMGDM